jgi:hypothetical protein
MIFHSALKVTTPQSPAGDDQFLVSYRDHQGCYPVSCDPRRSGPLFPLGTDHRFLLPRYTNCNCIFLPCFSPLRFQPAGYWIFKLLFVRCFILTSQYTINHQMMWKSSEKWL